jgi:uncharacterized protein (AIM24 family)
MPVPTIMPTGVRNESYAGVTYHIEGELVPVLQIELQAQSVYFEHYILLWKEPNVEIGVKQMKGAFKRVMAGMPIFLTQASGHGRIAFSRDGAGHVIAMHLAPGEAIDVREHQFLAATDNVEYGFTRVKGASNMLFGGTGFFIDSFECRSNGGILWLHGYGNVFEVTLGPGEQIDIEPGGWVYKDRSVQMLTQRQTLKTGLFASAGSFVWNRFIGPGRVGLQSMYLHMPTAD